MSLKQKTISGLLWSFIDNFTNQGIQFIFGIILARILEPKEFGLVGMLTVFIAVSQSFINSGFGQALIRKKESSPADFSTVFYFNIAISVICYLILFFSSGAIARFFEEPQLKPLLKVLGVSLIINAFGLIQQTILTKRIDFKLQTRISVFASLISGIVAVGMAYSGFGVWSLVAKTIIMYFTTSLLLWIWNKWKPIFVFSIQSFKELFRFGSNLLISGLIDTIYRNVYYLIIGKYFSARELGFYTRADQFHNIPSQNLASVIQRVSYPVLSSIKEDIPKLRDAYRKIIRSTMFVCFVLMFGMAAIARPMVITLIGEKWEPCVVYLQLLCFVGMFYPLHALNLNMLQVKGRSDLFLRLEIIKKLLAIPIIVFGILWGIKIMIICMIVNSLIAYYINSYWSGQLIGYSSWKQVRDIIPSLFLAATMSLIVFVGGLLLPLSPPHTLLVQVTLGALLTVGLSELVQFKDYMFIREIVKDKLLKRIIYQR